MTYMLMNDIDIVVRHEGEVMGERTANEPAPAVGGGSSVSGREGSDSKRPDRLRGLEHEVQNERLDPR